MADSSEELAEVGMVADLAENDILIVEIGGQEIAIFDLDGELHGLDNICTHQGGPLGEGKVEGECVYCPWHGHQFDIRTGEHGQISRLDTETYEVSERDGKIFVSI